jgi:hypothetical protein
MCNKNYEVCFTKLRLFLGFHELLLVVVGGFNEGCDIEDFWEFMTEYHDYKDYQVKSIKHVVICCIQRALA